MDVIYIFSESFKEAAKDIFQIEPQISYQIVQKFHLRINITQEWKA